MSVCDVMTKIVERSGTGWRREDTAVRNVGNAKHSKEWKLLHNGKMKIMWGEEDEGKMRMSGKGKKESRTEGKGEVLEIRTYHIVWISVVSLICRKHRGWTNEGRWLTLP